MQRRRHLTVELMRRNSSRNKEKLVNAKELSNSPGDLEMAEVNRIKRSTVDRNTLSLLKIG
jgi:hypothetical protein